MTSLTISGEADKLVVLLSTLGYSQAGGAWGHTARRAIFVGDLIDRGPKQLETLDIARAMVEGGLAQCILGYHEFNAVAWMTEDPDRPGQILRDHQKAGNQEQHQAFLDAVAGTSRQKEIGDWCWTLALWLDSHGLRVVHACGHEESRAVLRPVNMMRECVGSFVLQGSA